MRYYFYIILICLVEYIVTAREISKTKYKISIVYFKVI